MIRVALAALLCTLLAACGGGGGGGASGDGASVPSSGNAATRTDLLVGYFGVGDGQLAATAATVNFVFTRDDGDWNLPDYDAFRTSTTIMTLQEAKARGVQLAFVSIGWIVFSQHPGCTNACYLPRPDAITRLITFRQQLAAAGVDAMVVALYPADEPELRGLNDDALLPLLAAIKTAWPGPKLAVIYGSNGATPGHAGYDWIGRDDYGAREAVLQHLPPIRADQRWIVVPGGANPWRQDPQPFAAFANATLQVAVFMPFLCANYEGGLGICNNGMLGAYSSAMQRFVPSRPGG